MASGHPEAHGIAFFFAVVLLAAANSFDGTLGLRVFSISTPGTERTRTHAADGRALTMRPTPGLELRTKLGGGDTSVVVATGELDFATRDELVELLSTIEDIGTARIILDARGVTFIDSAGLHVMIAAHKRALAGGWVFQIVCGPGRVWRAVTMSGLATELHFLSRVPGDE
jgi:anti-anti-sigma factor